MTAFRESGLVRETRYADENNNVQCDSMYRPSGFESVLCNGPYIIQEFTGGGHLGWDFKHFKYARGGPGFKARGISGESLQAKKYLRDSELISSLNWRVFERQHWEIWERHRKAGLCSQTCFMSWHM